jgi:hypothetical protein
MLGHSTRNKSGRMSTREFRFSKNAVTLVVAFIGVFGGWGTAYLSNYDKIQQSKALRQEAKDWARLREGHYQWQWSKEGWLGDISIKKDATGQLCAAVDVSKYCTHWGAPCGKVLLSLSCGSVTETAEGLPKVTIPVNHQLYDDAGNPTQVKQETLIIVLTPKEAYTGSVDYVDASGKSSTGNIALINWEYKPSNPTK